MNKIILKLHARIPDDLLVVASVGGLIRVRVTDALGLLLLLLGVVLGGGRGRLLLHFLGRDVVDLASGRLNRLLKARIGHERFCQIPFCCWGLQKMELEGT